MKFIFLSPNFPSYFDLFCDRLHRKGVTVLGIGDVPYETLSDTLKKSLTEYYYLPSFEDYDNVYKACGFFIHKYGRIDHIQSLNEFWLVMEAKLRTDFNIKGVHYPEVLECKQKSAMKKFFKQAEVPSAKYIIATDIETAQKFVQEVGYPLVAKPDTGVGATDTFKINNDGELSHFFRKQYHGYILEEFVNGDIVTFEGITDNEGRLLFYSSHEILYQLMDVVNEDEHTAHFGQMNIDPNLLFAARKIAFIYSPKTTFFHFEFFRLKEDKAHLGRKGDYVALEVNMRPPGGLITEIINYTYDIDIYDAWANVVAFNALGGHISPKRYVGFASRRYRKNYIHTNEDIYRSFGTSIIMKYDVEPGFRKAMGDYAYLFRANTEDDIRKIVKYIQEERDT